MADMSKAEKLAAARKRLKEFQQHKDVSLSGASSHRSLQKSPLSIVDHNTTNKIVSENKINSENKTISENIKHNVTVNQQTESSAHAPDVESVRNIEHTLNGNYNSRGDSATPDMLVMPDVVGDSESQNPRKVDIFFRETSPHLFNQSPQKIRNSAVDFFDNLPGSLPISTVSVTQPESVPYIGKSEAVNNFNSDQQSTILQQHQHQQNKDVSTSINQSPVQQHQPLFDSFQPITSVYSKHQPLFDSSQPVTSVNSTSVLDLNVKVVKEELESRLMEEHQRNNVLDQQLRECKAHISHLEETVSAVRNEGEKRLETLEEKLQLHIKTLEIMVAEKTELQNALLRSQEENKIKSGEVEELQNRLRASRHRVADLERELNQSKTLYQQLEKATQLSRETEISLKTQVDNLSKQIQEMEGDLIDLRGKLEAKIQEVVTLQHSLQDKDSQLSISQLRIQQLSSSDEEDPHEGEVKQLKSQNSELQKKIELLEHQIKALNQQGDEVSREYQQYVNSLNTQLQDITAKYETASIECAELSQREQQLVKHVSDLEKQLQSRIRTPVIPPPASPSPDLALQNKLQQTLAEKQQLENRLSEQSAENEKLKIEIVERIEKIEELETSLERLEAERPDAVSLQAAIESDKVAASRAVSQNTILKKQLEELQDAFNKLKSNKLELTEKLEHEQHLSKDLSQRLAQLQITIAGPMDHNTKEDKTNEGESYTFVENHKIICETACQTTNDTDLHFDQPVDIEAMKKLEEKFKQTMQEVAELTDEKQRLEHLVEQLQYETDTIGEYITLYQVQRSMLRQRAQEKDEQVARIEQDREVLRNKLAQLSCLVQSLLPEKGHAHHNGYDNPATTPVGDVPDVIVSTEATENMCCQTETAKLPVQPLEETVNAPVSQEETAHRIRALITEIGSSKLVTSSGDHNINFHPCPWCSGRLITV